MSSFKVSIGWCYMYFCGRVNCDNFLILFFFSKSEEINPPVLKEVLFITNKQYTREDVTFLVHFFFK